MTQLHHTPTRERSREELLAAISASPGCTRHELSAASGLSRSAVTQVVRRLLAEGAIEEVATETKGRGTGSGRPATLLRVRPSSSRLAGLDFGHNHIRAAVADAVGNLLGESVLEHDVDADAHGAMDIGARELHRLLAEAGEGDVGTVVAGIPGPLDQATGMIRSPTILAGWVDIAPAAELSRRLGLPVVAENDAFLGAVGEARLGAGRGASEVLYVKAAHGVGAGVIIGGQPYRGSIGIAGEIGHVNISGREELCRCGNRGCLEAVIGVNSIRTQIVETHPGLAPADVDLTQPQDEITSRLIRQAGRDLGSVLAVLCDLLNPSVVVIGGELTAPGPAFVEGVVETARRYMQPAASSAVRIVAGDLGVRAEVMGALSLAATLAHSGTDAAAVAR